MDYTIGCTSRPYNNLSYEEAYAHIAAAGYTDVAVFANEGKTPVDSSSSTEEIATVRQAAANAGVVPSMLLGRTKLDLGLDEAVDDYKRLIDNIAQLGTRWLLDCGTGKEAHYQDYFELMQRTAPHAQAAGVEITMKPHGGISLTAEDLIGAFAKVDRDAFAICYDPGNIIFYTVGERRPETDVEKVVHTLSTAIIKDCVVVDGKADVMVTPGDGLVDFPTILGKLAGGGFAGPYYVECVGGKTTEEVDRDLAFTLGYVKGILAGL